MKFLVHAQAANVAMSYDDVSLLTATQRQFSELPQIESVMSFAGERAFALIVNVNTAAELDHLIFGHAGERLMDFDVHVIVD
jgi:hypothetical protein